MVQLSSWCFLIPFSFKIGTSEQTIPARYNSVPTIFFMTLCHLSSNLELGYTRDWLPAYSFVLRARAMVLTGERTLSGVSGARQYCPRAWQTAADNYVYRLLSDLKNRLQRAHQHTDWDAKLRHSPGMPAAEKHKLVYETPNYVISHAAARWYHCTTVNYRDSSVHGYHDKTVLPCGVSRCPCS
jgi:hypothetical protein